MYIYGFLSLLLAFVASIYVYALNPSKLIFLVPVISSFLALLYVIQLLREPPNKPANKDKTPHTPRNIPAASKIHAPFALGSPEYTTSKITAMINRIIPIFSQSPSAINKVQNKDLNLFPSSPSERGIPAPTLHARLPQKTPSASLGQARCLSNTAITQGEPSPKARRAFPLTQKLSLDHATGEPRGLLHQPCNMKVAQIETSTPYPRLVLTELALQFRKKHYQLLCAVLSYTEGSLALRCLSWP